MDKKMSECKHKMVYGTLCVECGVDVENILKNNGNVKITNLTDDLSVIPEVC
jgi:hypothetical protein